ncbi:DUF396-domain-containing protein [Phlegmacium glaucopus]|nr:DUF396-domain-containing protein [Phlegmacium glaucopus]
MGLLYYFSYFAMLAAFAFMTLSLASGLLYASELIEEHSRLAKTLGQRSVYIIILLHGLFCFTDRLPLLQTLFSIVCHIVYLQNFSNTWPLISLTSVTFLASCVLVIADHFAWFFYFARVTNDAHHLRTYRGIAADTHSFTEIASFFGICVWFIPLYLFLSLSANDNALPTTTTEPSSPSVTSSIQAAKARVSLIRSIFSLVSFDGVSRIRQTRRGTTEGLIAPRSPAPSHSAPSHVPSSPSLRLRPQYPPPPPRSPRTNPDVQEIEVHLSPKVDSEFKLLDTTPRRRLQSNQRPMGKALGLGIGMSSRTSTRSLLVEDE